MDARKLNVLESIHIHLNKNKEKNRVDGHDQIRVIQFRRITVFF